MENKRVKVNILTGFFGSGKTTLISNMSKEESLKNKMAIIQNEFSEGKLDVNTEMGIEKDTLTDTDGKSLGNLYEMPNGCLCCVVKDNVVVFIENLINKRNDLDVIIIEAHGLSDISLLLKKFWLDKELESPIQLNSIICLVDALNFEKNRKNHSEVFINQILSADKIVINKIDLIKFEKEKIDYIKNELLEINPLAVTYETEHSKLSQSIFLEQIDYSKGLAFENDKEHSHHHEKHDIENIIIRSNFKSKEEMDKAIGNILWNLSDSHNISLIRFKGILATESACYIIQGLYDLYEFDEIKNLSNPESKVLLIGKNLTKNRIFLEKALNN